MAQNDTRAALLKAGDRLLLTSGYAGTGLSEILASAGVPKGSFYHWFSSKQAYVGEVAEWHYAEHDTVLRSWVRRPEPAADRLAGYFRQVRDGYAAALTADAADPVPAGAGPSGNETAGAPVGCLLGGLALDVAETDPVLRERLAGLFDRWRARLAELLQQARQEGALPENRDVARLAAVLLDAWEGALMRMRLTRSVRALDEFLAVTLPLAVPRP